MAYMTSHRMLQSPGLKQRLTVAAAAEGRADAPMWVEQNLWAMLPLMIEPGGQKWWQVWEYAEQTATFKYDENQDIGLRSDVILDEWISTVVATHIQSQSA